MYYKYLLSNKPYGWRFADIYDIDCQAEGANCSEELLTKRARITEAQFATVQISLGNPVITEFKDFEAITLSSFLASLGGVLNLWSGISIFIILECIDWSVKIWTAKVNKIRNKELPV